MIPIKSRGDLILGRIKSKLNIKYEPLPPPLQFTKQITPPLLYNVPEYSEHEPLKWNI